MKKSFSSVTKKLRTVIVGCGCFGIKRLQSCKNLHDDFDVIGLVETDHNKARQVTKKYALQTKSSISDFAKSKINLAIIVTPNNTHSPLSVEALSLGMHVLCEKPLAISTPEANKIVSASKKYKRFVKTGSNHRFIPYIEKAISLVKTDAIGRVLRMNGSIGNNGEHVAKGWFWNKQLSGGGTLIDNGCHLIDIVTLLMKGMTLCSAQISTSYWGKASVEDNASVLLTTKDGRQATITSSWTKWNGYLSLEIWGSNGFIQTNSDSQLVIHGNKQGKVIKTYDFSQDKTVSYEKELLYFKECIEKGIPPEPDAQDGARVIRIIETAYTSARLKKHVSV